MYGGAATPAGWLLCDGSAYNSVTNTQYADLYSAIGNTYGGSDGTDFQVPNFLDRMPVGADTLTTGAGAYSLGATGGAATHTLTESEMPSHTHTQNAHSHVQGATTSTGLVSGPQDATNKLATTSGTSTATTVAVNQNTGGGSAHNNLPPYIGVTFIISY